MLRRLVLLLAALASLSIVATPALGASTYQVREQGSGLNAHFSNFPFGEAGHEEGEAPPAGDFFDTYVYASTYLASGAEAFEFMYVCVDHWEFTIDENGEWVDGSGLFACGEADTLSVDARLTNGHVAATLPVEDCLAWDEETHECLESIVLGELEVDLTLSGAGPVQRYHGTSTGGTAGFDQYVFHGTGSYRAATPAGTVSLDGVSLVDGATTADGTLFQSKSGWLEVYH